MNSFKHLAALTAAFLMGTSLVSCGSRSVSTNIVDTPIITVTITETETVTEERKENQRPEGIVESVATETASVVESGEKVRVKSVMTVACAVRSVNKCFF